MKIEELTLIENQIYTQLLLEEFKKQRKAGAIAPADFLLDKYEVDRQTKDKLKEYLTENK